MATDTSTGGLTGSRNRYGDFIIDAGSLPQSASEFEEQLGRTLPGWRAGHKVLWLEVPLQAAALIPVAVGAGFVFHHARAKALTLTLAPTPDSFVYPDASHYVGAGGVVIDERRRVLVVSERFRGDMSRPYYKLPGGLLHHREDLADGVTREVFEETGVRTRFLAINSVRHRHTGAFDHSDLYIVCRLAPLTQEIVIQASEIEECFWMPVDDYLTLGGRARLQSPHRPRRADQSRPAVLAHRAGRGGVHGGWGRPEHEREPADAPTAPGYPFTEPIIAPLTKYLCRKG